MESWGSADDERVGRQVRHLRVARGLTMTQLAGRAELSQGFLSQLERGQARPSMASLSRIARALGSSQLELIAGIAEAVPAGTSAALVREAEGDHGRYGLGEARLLVRGDRPFYPMTFAADNVDPSDFHTHPEDEFVHLLEGRCGIDLAEETYQLEVGDSLYYAGGTPHRWYSLDGNRYRLIVVKQHVVLGTPTAGAAPRSVTELQETTP